MRARVQMMGGDVHTEIADRRYLASLRVPAG